MKSDSLSWLERTLELMLERCGGSLKYPKSGEELGGAKLAGFYSVKSGDHMLRAHQTYPKGIECADVCILISHVHVSQ